jgi:N-methylhydantoinase A
MTHVRYRAGVDVGGTFTDLVLACDETGETLVGKTLTTPRDPAEGVLRVLDETLERAGRRLSDVETIVHGTTLVTNCILERTGARTALLTTRGFRDAVEIAREHRYDLYDLFLTLPRPLVPRYLRVEVDERIAATGDVLRPLDIADAEMLIEELRQKGVEAVAICLLHSYVNPAHERALEEAVRRRAPEMAVSLSSEVAPSLGEYERASTTIANAYVAHRVGGYVSALEDRLRRVGFGGRLFLLLSNGGITEVETAARFPIRILESGPAGGALATAAHGEQLAYADLLSFDMGGTTAKMCVVEGGVPLTSAGFEVDRVYRFKKGSGLPIAIPVIDMMEIGAGGGSIARVDSLGLLRVGPESAGADPGPACYGRGGKLPTVTDADLLLGYLSEEYFLGGEMALDRKAAESALGELAARLDRGLLETAWSVHALVNESMATAARVHMIERGKDPRSLPLFAFGGAGPVHACGVAAIVHSPEVIVPVGAGVMAAAGFLFAPLSFEFVRTAYGRLDALALPEIESVLHEMEAEGRRLLHSAGVPDESIAVTRLADVRYLGQGHEVRVPLPDGALSEATPDAIRTAFDAAYERLYARRGPDVPLEALHWRVIVAGPRPSPPRPAQRAPERASGADGAPQPFERDAAPAIKSTRPAYQPEHRARRPIPVYDRWRLLPGMTLRGPAIIEERESTTVLTTGWSADVDALSHLRLRPHGSVPDARA